MYRAHKAVCTASCGARLVMVSGLIPGETRASGKQICDAVGLAQRARSGEGGRSISRTARLRKLLGADRPDRLITISFERSARREWGETRRHSSRREQSREQSRWISGVWRWSPPSMGLAKFSVCLAGKTTARITPATVNRRRTEIGRGGGGSKGEPRQQIVIGEMRELAGEL